MASRNWSDNVTYRLTLLAVAIAGVMLLLLLDHRYRISVSQDSSQRLDNVATTLQHRLSRRVNRLILVAADLRAFLVVQHEPLDSQVFARFAEALRDHYPEIDALVYVGPDRIIRDIVPLKGNEQTIGLDLSKRPVAPYVEEAILERRLIVDPPHIMTNGEQAVIARMPMFRGDEFIGLAQAVIRVQDIVQNILGEYGREFNFRLLDENGKLFWGDGQLEEGSQDRPVVVANGVWTLQVFRNQPQGVSVFVLALIWGAGGLVLLLALHAVRSNHRQHLVLKTEVAEATRELCLRNEVLEQQILQRLEAEEKLRRSEQGLREAQQIARVGSWERDIIDNRLYWSDELFRIFGFSPQAFEPTFGDFIARVHLDDREIIRKGLVDSQELNVPFEPQYRITLPGGELRYVRASGIVISDAEGRPLRTAGTVQDVTEQTLARHALEESERKYRTVLECANDGIIITSLDGKVLDVNRRFQTLLGYSREELLRMHVSQYHHPSDQEILQAAFSTMRELGFSLFEHLVLRKDGSTALVEVAGALATIGDQQLAIGVFRDISERKRIEAELHQYRNHLEQLVEQRTSELMALNSELESFSYSVSHDLRAPLRVINGFSVALCEDYGAQLEGPGRDYLERIRSATERMGRLIDDLLRLSRTIRTEMKWENVSLSKMVSELLQELSAADIERKIRLAVADGVVARGDSSLIRSLLQNLLNNAWKFTRERADAVIEFGVDHREGKTIYFVRDNGIGFDMSHAREIFKPFTRLHGATDYEGSGIGLATVQRIIQHHGGEIWAESEPEKGAVFYFTLGPA